MSQRDYLPDPDQCRYALHLFNKQLAKLEHARRQLHDMITKFEILLQRSIEKERESDD